MKSEQIKEITEKTTEQLVAALQQGHSEALTSYLKAIGCFHRYSLHNVLLIALQKPNASYVAGFRTWNELGRFVKKVEKGIMNLAPIVRRKAENSDDDEKEPSRIAGFRAAYVFDVNQTDGQDLPQIGMVHGDPREYSDGLRRFAAAQNIAIEYSEDIAPARGKSRWTVRQMDKENFVSTVSEVDLRNELAALSSSTLHFFFGEPARLSTVRSIDSG
jgi:hypothetical protein